MTVRTLYFDESGYTGYNLLDSAQPVFAISSADISNDAAEAILRESFPSYRGVEFKFSNIWRTNARSGLLTFARHLEPFADTAFTYMIDKRFGVLTKIVDFLIEPLVTNGGYDFYADGFCWKYCNYIHYGLTEFAPPELLDRLLTIYQDFSRNPTPQTLAVLQSQLRLIAQSLEEPVQIFIGQMADGAEAFEHFTDLETFKSSNELHTTSMVAIISHWRQRHSEDFAVVHDASSTFLRQRRMWKNITSPNVPEQIHRGGDGSETPFPLRVVSTEAADSKDHFAIQFCDVLAGLCVKHFGSSANDPDRAFLDEVIQAGLGTLSYNGIRPSTIFPDQIPPRPLSGPDVVDQLAMLIRDSERRRS
ncbi:DUF3800 domain-containing protein (plasmid) [Peteryoungia desertarenae]|uniref:DUF3800 domain-containing protein n=1 Tax=Peteryoungia desertarenae TaxID=1813451 RepID=A0ABX6QU90_9HYPH|nr:DUF3800 domain-containing protein [Peteryoungia desertarenae]QLF71770.1 DUF3800 domain-containing protein [Peteryoungia desertarenae]